MLTGLRQSRGLMALRGIVAVIFGIFALIWPGLTALTLVFWLGAYLVIDGVIAVITGLRHHATNDRWWLLLIEGVLGILAGIAAFVFPVAATFALLIVIAAWAILSGVFEIAAAVRLRREIHNEWALGLMGVLSIVLGIILLVNPTAGLLGVVWAIGIYAILFGLLNLWLAFTAGRYTHREGENLAG